LLAQPEILVPPLPALALPAPPLLLVRRPLLLLSLRHARARPRPGHGWVGPSGIHMHHLRESSEASEHAGVARTSKARKSEKIT
jgi:hypothetical protein